MLDIHKPDFEEVITRALADIKEALDFHMEVYNRNADGTRSTPYDEAISISAVARVSYEAVAYALQLYPVSLTNHKHRYVVKMFRKFIRDHHHNNIIIDHPRSDASAFARGLVLFLASVHQTMLEASTDGQRQFHTKQFLDYRQHRHDDDNTKWAKLPTFNPYRETGVERLGQ